MNCPLETQEGSALLLEFSTDRLPGAARTELQSHISNCAACGKFVREQNALWSALDVWEAPVVPADFDQRLYSRIEQEVSWWDLLLRPVRPAFRHALPIAAAAGVVLMAGLLLDRPSAVPARTDIHPAVQAEPLRPDQVEHALAEIEMLDQFNHAMRANTDSHPKM